MKTILNLFLVILITLAVLVLARNVVVKAAVENGTRAVLGMPSSLGKLDLNLANTLVDVEDLTVKNPAGFHGTTLVTIPKILVDYNLSAILKGKIHVENLEFNMEQFTVVRNEKGQLNLDSLKALQEPKPASAGQEPVPGKAGKAPEVQIDHFRLKVGKVVFIDYSGGQPSTQEFLVGIDQSYRDITDLNKLVKLIVAKSMMNTTIANLTNFDLGALQGSVSGILSTGTDMATQMATKGVDTLVGATQEAGQFAGQTGETLKGTASTVTGGVKDAASAVKNKLKLPF